MSSKILIIDDEKTIRDSLQNILEYEGYEITVAENGHEGLLKLQEIHFNLALCDIKMPKMDGLELLSKAQEEGIETPFVMISGHGNIDTAIDAIKQGAFDYISKPPDLNRLLMTVKNALEKKSLIKERKNLIKQISSNYSLIGYSPAIQSLRETIEKVANTEARVLILGENGTGKELVAHNIHQKSARSANPIVEVNCAAIPSELIESELFGHEKGSFTSAIKQKIGKFEEAHDGTLFLDEIGDMSLTAQAKVLRALQEGKITRLGGTKDINVNVRVLAATNKNLLEEVEQKNFRLDLYHRLSVININVPSLRDRKEDIPELVTAFLSRIAKEYGVQPKSIDADALKLLQKMEWTGNVRELRNVIERLIILGNDPITKSDVQQFVNS